MIKAFKFRAQAIFILLEKTHSPGSQHLSSRIFSLFYIISTQRTYTFISIKVVHEQSGKVANKLMNVHSDSQQPFALVFDFSALLVDNLN